MGIRAYNRWALRELNKLPIGFENEMFLRVVGNMQREQVSDAIWKVIVFQIVITLVLSLATVIFVDKPTSLSVLAGAFIIVAGNLSYGWIARRSMVMAKPAGQVLLRHVLAQIAKLLIIFGLMLGAFTSNWFQAGWLVASMGAALLVHWMSLLFVR